MAAPISIHDKLLHSSEAAKILGVSVAWLSRERWKGNGPAYVRVGGRAVRYRLADINAYIASKTVTPARGRG